jgi:hypothetical protein
MTYDLHSVDACGKENCRDRCGYRMGVELGGAHEYVAVLGRDVLSKCMQGKVALGWNIARRGIARVKACGYVIDRKFRSVDPPGEIAVLVAEVVKVHAGV